MPQAEEATSPCRAVQYLRVSSEQQEYSVDAQRAAISRFADAHGIEIFDTYLDLGKSGLTLKGRPGLQRLLHDVMTQGRSFDVILVYDVSRWGRFQDPDQAAHYEFLCRQVGVQVVYCAEPFGGDDLLTTSVLKSLKRVMAAEYSRELSTKIHAAHLRGARQGLWEGASPPYGLRRQLVDDAGNPLAVMEQGQHKASKVHRCKVVWGPASEISTIRRIFSLYVTRRWPPARIADALNAEGLRTKLNGRWSAVSIRAALTQRLYTGVQTYNRLNQKLKGKPQRNAPEKWIQVRVMRPIVSQRLFDRAATMLAEGWRKYTPNSLLDALRRLLKTHGYLSWQLIHDSDDTPDPITFRKYFGGLKKAYALVGYERRYLCSDGKGRLTAAQVLKRLKSLQRKQGFLSQLTIDAVPDLPPASTVTKIWGSPRNCYAAVGINLSRSDIMRAAYERKRRLGPIISSRPPLFPKDEQLEGLRRLLEQHGRLDRHMIVADPELPSHQTVARTFGSLTAAYCLAGAVRLRRGEWVAANTVSATRA